MISIQDSTRTTLQGFDIDLLPSAAFQYIAVHQYRADNHSIVLEAGPYVGLIPLLNGESIYIAPRIGNRAFARMISVVNNLDKSNDNQISQIDASGNNPTNWMNIVGGTFRKYIEIIEMQGLRFASANKTVNTKFAKGKVNYRLSTIALERQTADPIVSSIKVKTYSTPENKLLSVAAFLVNRSLYGGKDLLLSKWAQMMSDNKLSQSEYDDVVQKINSGHFDDYRSYYKPALKTALLLIPGNITGLDFNLNNLDITPFVTNINLLYEDYIRTIITKGLIKKGFVVVKPKGNLTSLFTDGKYRLIPDVTISSSTNLRLIGDMKYKPRDDTVGQDYYQLKTYIDAHNLSYGFLVRPAGNNSGTRINRHEYFDGKLALDISLDISDYENSEIELLKQLDVLIF